MRRPRIKADGAGYYHCMSRFIERRHVFGPKEKERFLALIRKLAAFSGLEILTGKPWAGERKPGKDCGN